MRLRKRYSTRQIDRKKDYKIKKRKIIHQAEAARALGISRQRVLQLAQNKHLTSYNEPLGGRMIVVDGLFEERRRIAKKWLQNKQAKADGRN